MPVSAETLAILIDKGLSGADLVDVVRSIDTDTANAEPVRTRRQERNHRYYMNQKAKREAELAGASENVSIKTSDKTPESGVGGFPKEKPHTPKENSPLPSPPKGGSVSAPAGGSKSSRGHRLPDDWEPDESDHDYGRNLGLSRSDIASSLENLRQWAWSNVGAKVRKNDWHLTFKGFLKRDARDKNARAGPVRSSSKPNGYYAGSLTRQPELTDVLDRNTSRSSNGYAESDVDREHGRGPTLEASASSGRGGEVFHIEGFGPNAGGHRRTG